MKKNNYKPNPKPYGLALLAMCACQPSTDQCRDTITGNENLVDISSTEEVPQSTYSIAEKSPERLFIRIAVNGKVNLKVAVDIIATYAGSYNRIDICEPGHTERGEECMSYMNGILVDFRTGESYNIQP